MFKRILLTVMVLGLGLSTISVNSVHAIEEEVLPPSHSLNVTCEALTINLNNYAATQPAQSEQGYTEYQWVKHHSAVTHTEWKYWTLYKFHYQEQWFNANALPGILSGWHPLFEHQTVTDSAAYDEYAWSVTAPSVSGWTNTEKSRWVVTSPAVPEKTNSITVDIDGTNKANTTFSTTYSNTFNFSNKYIAHSYSIVVTAWNGIGSFTLDDISTIPCVPDQPSDTVTTVTTEDPIDCVKGTIVQTVVTTTTSSSLVNNVWIPSTPVSKTVTTTRSATTQELATCSKGEVLSASTIKSLPVTSGDMSISDVVTIGSIATFATLISFIARSVLIRRV